MTSGPTWNDAWLLAAIYMGQGQAEKAVGWADHINATSASDYEWAHAFDVLGRLGLVVAGEHFPIASPLGTEIFKKCALPGLGAREYPKLILKEIEELPSVADPVAAPSWNVMRDAEAKHRQQMKEAVARAVAEWKAEHPPKDSSISANFSSKAEECPD